MLNLYDKISLVIYQISCHQDYSKDFFFLLTLNFTQLPLYPLMAASLSIAPVCRKILCSFSCCGLAGKSISLSVTSQAHQSYQKSYFRLFMGTTDSQQQSAQ